MRDGNDLVTVVDVPAPLAALGTRVTVPTLEGDEELEIPAGTQPRDVFELRGHGMPSLRRTLGGTGGRQGDLRVVVNVVIPRHLNAEQRDLLERLAESIGPENLAPPDEEHGVFAKLKRALRGVIRLAIRVRRADAEVALAELLELAPSGVEEVDDGGDVVEYAVYGPPGELPALPDLQAAAGGALVEVTTTEVADDWDERWKAYPPPAGARRAHRAPAVGRGRGAPRRAGGRDRPGTGVRHRRARDDADVPGAAALARPRRGVRRLGLRVGCAGDRGGEARLGAGARRRPRFRERGGDAAERRRQRRGGHGGAGRPARRTRARGRRPRRPT